MVTKKTKKSQIKQVANGIQENVEQGVENIKKLINDLDNTREINIETPNIISQEKIANLEGELEIAQLDGIISDEEHEYVLRQYNKVAKELDEVFEANKGLQKEYSNSLEEVNTFGEENLELRDVLKTQRETITRKDAQKIELLQKLYSEVQLTTELRDSNTDLQKDISGLADKCDDLSEGYNNLGQEHQKVIERNSNFKKNNVELANESIILDKEKKELIELLETNKRISREKEKQRARINDEKAKAKDLLNKACRQYSSDARAIETASQKHEVLAEVFNRTKLDSINRTLNELVSDRLQIDESYEKKDNETDKSPNIVSDEINLELYDYLNAFAGDHNNLDVKKIKLLEDRTKKFVLNYQRLVTETYAGLTPSSSPELAKIRLLLNNYVVDEKILEACELQTEQMFNITNELRKVEQNIPNKLRVFASKKHKEEQKRLENELEAIKNKLSRTTLSITADLRGTLESTLDEYCDAYEKAKFESVQENSVSAIEKEFYEQCNYLFERGQIKFAKDLKQDYEQHKEHVDELVKLQLDMYELKKDKNEKKVDIKDKKLVDVVNEASEVTEQPNRVWQFIKNDAKQTYTDAVNVYNWAKKVKIKRPVKEVRHASQNTIRSLLKKYCPKANYGANEFSGKIFEMNRTEQGEFKLDANQIKTFLKTIAKNYKTYGDATIVGDGASYLISKMPDHKLSDKEFKQEIAKVSPWYWNRGKRNLSEIAKAS